MRKRKKAFVITKIKQKLIFVTPKKFLGKKVIGISFLILGSMLLATSIFYFFLTPFLLPKKCPLSSSITAEKEIIKKIFFPRINWELTATEGKLSGGQWILPENSLAYLPTEDVFEGKNNLVFFGNKLKVLNKLNLVKKQDLVYLLGESRYLIFEVNQIERVAASEESIFANTPQKNLILFSTTDYLKGERLLIRAIKK